MGPFGWTTGPLTTGGIAFPNSGAAGALMGTPDVLGGVGPLNGVTGAFMGAVDTHTAIGRTLRGAGCPLKETPGGLVVMGPLGVAPGCIWGGGPITGAAGPLAGVS